MPRGGKRPGAGRPKGSRNTTSDIRLLRAKDMILQALANVGGVAYLEAQAEHNPSAFLALVGTVLQLPVKRDGAGL